MSNNYLSFVIHIHETHIKSDFIFTKGSITVEDIIFQCYEWVINYVSSDVSVYYWVSWALCLLRGAQHHGDALTSSSISTACSSPNQMPAPLHKVEEERCHSLNRIYGLSLRHKLDSKYITVKVAASAATCLYWCRAKTHSCLLARQT